MDSGSPEERLAALRCGHMRPFEGARFRSRAEDGTTQDWVLREVRDEGRADGRHGPASLRRPFSLYFEPSDGRPSAQGRYVLESERFPALEIFLTPVLIEPGRVWMQAVFH